MFDGGPVPRGCAAGVSVFDQIPTQHVKASDFNRRLPLGSISGVQPIYDVTYRRTS